MDIPVSFDLLAEGLPSALEEEVGQLFEHYHHPVFRYLVSLGLAAQDAEEITQEVFLALFQHLRHGKSRENLRGWIFRVAHNQGLKLRERIVRRGPPARVEHVETHCDPKPNPEEMVLSNQRQRRLSAVIQALSEQDRACLSLRAEGLRYREIAGILNISLGSVSLSLERAITKLTRANQA